MDEKTQSEDVASLRILNESAIREHALECAAKFRAARFTRVGEDFLNEVRADVEAWLRELRNKWQTQLHEPLEPGENSGFVTGALRDKIVAELNRGIGRIIQNKVQRQPSCGKTLSATR